MRIEKYGGGQEVIVQKNDGKNRSNKKLNSRN